MLKITLLSLAAWASTVALYLLGMTITAAIVGSGSVRTSTAEVVFLALLAVDVIIACIAVAFVFSRSQGVFRPVVRVLWVVAFALLQIATLALAVLTLMLALNR